MSTKQRIFIFFLAIVMVITSLPASIFAANDFNYDNISEEKTKFLNKEKASNPAELGDDPTTTEEANAQIKNADMPRIFDIRAEYKAMKDDALVHLFQPYEATVGDDEYTYKDSKGNPRNVISEEEKNKINKQVDLPDIDGYTKPTEATNFDYDYIKNKGLSGKQKDNRFTFFYPYIYTAQEGEIKVKHIFQNLYDKNEYGFKDGEKEDIYTTANGFIGQEITVSPLSEKERRGYVPEKTVIKTRVPDDIADYVIEYRYNRDSFNVSYDMDGGSPIPSQTLYYGQTIPNLNVKPKKIGGIFVGWKSDTDLNYKDANGNIKTIHKDTKFDMKDFKDGIKEAMPAKDVKFTALWKDEPKANYTIQFWTEKADSAGYDYIGAKVVKDADTGSRPDLSLMMPSGIKFPEIEKSLTEDAKVNELNKYFVRNEKKINKENTETVKQDDGTNVLLTKKVQPDGRTTYNIYYDRQTYTMLFEKFCIDEPDAGFPAKEAKMVLPDGTKYDSTKEVNKPYNFVAKFGERMKKWPNDMWLIGEGGIDFDPNMSFIGWQLNSENNGNLDQSLYLDTPPYWLTSKDFIDRDFTELDPAVTPATHSTSTGEKLPERTISLGPCSSAEYQFAIYYMEYLFEGFDGALHYNPDMSYTKIDTSGPYLYPSPGIVGFKPKYEGIKPVDDALESPEKKIGYTEDLSKLTFEELGKELDKTEEKRKNSEKSFFEPIAEKGINGVPFKDIDKYRFAFTYEREKYKLFLDTNPSDINEHSDFKDKKLASGKAATITDVYYDMPLRKLNLDKEYKLTEADRPANVPDDFVFKGWAMDPQGSKLIKDTVKKSEELEAKIAGKYEELAKNSKEKDKKFKIQNEIKELKAKLADADANMPNYDIVLYAKWGEPDKTFKVKFDPNQGNLSDIDPMDIATFKDGELIKTSADKTVYQLPEKLPNEGDVQVFNVKSRTKIKQPKDPKRKGYDFLGWELIRHKNDGSVDTSYMDKYGVPELYAFDNEVVEDAYLKAIWVKNDLLDIPVKHILLDENFKEKKDALPDSTVHNKRVGEYAEATAKYQGEDYLTIPEAEWDKLAEKSTAYKEYLDKTKRTNRYSQVLKVEPEKIKENGALVDNPKAENNYFMFFYREFTKRHYKVNYLSTTEEDADKLPGIGKKPDDSFKIIDTEEVTSGSTDYDAVNYREIPGWKIISTPQRQLFYDVNDDGEMIGINGVKSNEVNFYYKDIRVIKRKTPDAKTPDGYHRVVFKADRDGSFGKDAEGKPIKEVFYDVIDGLEFRNVPVPQEQDAQGSLLPPVITPDPNCEFVGWQDSSLLDGNTAIRRDYTFTAKFTPSKDVIEITTGDEDLPDYFVDVYLDTTDKADASITDNQFTGESKKHFKVNPEKIVEIPAADPQGGGVKDKDGNPVKDAKGKEAKWQFKSWQVKDDATKVWNKGETIKGQFTEKVTTIVAQYNLKWSDVEHVPDTEIGEMWVFESLKKDDGTWVNNFMPKKDQFDRALKKVTDLPEYQSYRIITIEEDIYDRVKEEGGPVGDSQPRTVKIQAEVTFKNGTKKVVNIPVKVFKNIYRALNDEDKPNVVKNNPELSNYVKVTVNPTDKAVDKQRSVYYVNPLAQVLIPEKDPKPIGNYTFEGWYYKDPAQVSQQNPQGRVEVDLAKRMMISQEREIIAAYSTPIQPIQPLEPTAGKIVKSIGDSLTVDDYEAVITPPKDKNGKDLRKILTIKIVKPKTERVTTEKDGNFRESIQVVYDDGSSAIIDVDVKVVPDYVPQTGEDKPEVPKNFVKVTCNPTDKAVDSTPHIYWVNPEKKVTLPEGDPTGKEIRKADGTTDYTWTFTGWNTPLTGTFKTGTTITAQYDKVYAPTPVTPVPTITYEDVLLSRGDPAESDPTMWKTDKEGFIVGANGQPLTDDQGKKIADPSKLTDAQKKEAKQPIPAGTTFAPDGKAIDGVTIDPATGKVTLSQEKSQAMEPGETLTVPVLITHPDGSSTVMDVVFRTREKSNPPQVNLVKFGEDKITGQGMPGAVITVVDQNGNPVNNKDGNPIQVTVDGNGGFTIPTSDLPDGVNPDDVQLTQQEKGKDPSDPVPVIQQGPKFIVSTNPDDPGEVKDGYVRLIFDATEHGTLADGQQKKVIDVREDVSYKDAELRAEFPQSATYKDASQKFEKWGPLVPETGKVEKQTFTAQYTENPKVITQDSDNPAEKPDGYVRLIFDATENGTVDGHTKKILDVRNDLTYADADLRAQLPTLATYNDVTMRFTGWDPLVPEDDTQVVDQIYTAQYAENQKVIVSDNPDDPGETPDGYVRMTFDATEKGTVEGHRYKVIFVRADVTYDDQALFDVLPDAAQYENTTKKFSTWSPVVPKEGLVQDNTLYVAQYVRKPVTPPVNPDKPNPDKPNPDKPNPDKPNPDQPNPDNPNPEGKDIVVNTGETPNPEDGIQNKDKLPKGTTYKFKNKVDTSKPGDKKAVIVVTYPDGSVKEVTVTVKVMAKRGATANKGATPKTGDTVLLGTIAMGAVAMGLYGVTLVAGKKKKTEDK